MEKPMKPPEPTPRNPGFAATFRHWRTGKLYRAIDYGHRAWPIGKRN